MKNRCSIEGRLPANALVSASKIAGAAVVRFTLVCEGGRTPLQFSVTAHGEPALAAAARMKKGSLVRVDGRMGGILGNTIEVLAEEVSVPERLNRVA